LINQETTMGREEYFKAKDKTGEIYVVTEQAVPKKGKVKIKGLVKEAFAPGEDRLTVILKGK